MCECDCKLGIIREEKQHWEAHTGIGSQLYRCGTLQNLPLICPLLPKRFRRACEVQLEGTHGGAHAAPLIPQCAEHNTPKTAATSAGAARVLTALLRGFAPFSYCRPSDCSSAVSI